MNNTRKSPNYPTLFIAMFLNGLIVLSEFDTLTKFQDKWLTYVILALIFFPLLWMVEQIDNMRKSLWHKKSWHLIPMMALIGIMAAYTTSMVILIIFPTASIATYGIMSLVFGLYVGLWVSLKTDAS